MSCNPLGPETKTPAVKQGSTLCCNLLFNRIQWPSTQCRQSSMHRSNGQRPRCSFTAWDVVPPEQTKLLLTQLLVCRGGCSMKHCSWRAWRKVSFCQVSGLRRTLPTSRTHNPPKCKQIYDQNKAWQDEQAKEKEFSGPPARQKMTQPFRDWDWSDYWKYIMRLAVRYSFANSKVISTFSRQSLWVGATSCFQSLSTSDPSVESRQSRAMQNTTTKKMVETLWSQRFFFSGRELNRDLK